MMLRSEGFWVALVLACGVVAFGFLASIGFAQGSSGLGELTTVLTNTGQEAKTSVVPAMSVILAVIVLLGVGAGIARVVARST